MQPVRKDIFCDLAIVGGGVGGCAAAIEAARKGLHVFIIEKGTTLGGLATNGYVPQVAGGIEGICFEFVKKLEEKGQLLKKMDFYRNCTFDPEYGKLTLEEMIMSSGARILYDATAFDCEMDGKNIKKVFFHTKGGVMAVQAKIFIDATGDADLAAMAGVPYEVGGPDYAGLNMSTTQGTRWGGANLEVYEAAEKEYRKDHKYPLVYDLETQWIEEGKLVRHVCNKNSGFFRVLIPNYPKTNAEFCTFSFHSYYCHNTDCEDISRQILEQHRLIEDFHKFLKEAVPGFENLHLVGMGSLPGVRDSRRIFGEYMLKATDVVCRTKFEDGIARFPEMLDTHHPTSADLVFQRHIHMVKPEGHVCTIQKGCVAQMHPFWEPEGVEVRPIPGDACEIPYRALLPLECDNLLAVGRCCSAEFHANGAMRIIGPAMGTGHAAGVAAVYAVENNMRPRDIDGKIVRNLLIEEGVALDQPMGDYWAYCREQEATMDMFVSGGDMIAFKPKA